MIIGVERIFDNHIRSRFLTKLSVANYLINHERKPIVMNKICEQIKLAEDSNIGVRFDAEKFKELIGAGADLFARAALNYAEEQAVTQAEKQRRIDEFDKDKEIKKLFSEGDEAAKELD